MRSRTPGTPIVLAGLLALAVPSGRAAVQQASPPLPEGDGKALVTRLCAGCHTLDTTLSKRTTVAGWHEIVDTMIARGAAITADEATAIARYLGQHFGPATLPTPPSGVGRPAAPSATPPPAAATRPPDASRAAASPAPAAAEDAGKTLLTAKCFQCHGQTMWRDLRLDRRGWEGVLYRMVGKGALWTEDEIATMSGYLARTAGPAADGRP
jgi:mono/diheme cytochrome c family protein